MQFIASIGLLCVTHVKHLHLSTFGTDIQERIVLSPARRANCRTLVHRSYLADAASLSCFPCAPGVVEHELLVGSFADGEEHVVAFGELNRVETG